jgi:hypothetical protein
MHVMIKRFKYPLLLLIVLAASSCNKWLTIKPQDGLIRADYWKTKEQLQAAVIGCYSSLLDNSLVTELFVWGELRADMVTYTLNTPADAINLMQGNVLASNRYTDWSPLYRTINNCNTVIQYGPSVLASDQTLTRTQLNAYLAEAHGLRALMYFYLVRTFGEVPLQMKATSTEDAVQQLVKSPRNVVMDSIMADLSFAQKYAPETYGDLNMDKGRITRYTVFAIEADACLWNSEYDSCIAACDSIIDSQRFGLIDGTNQDQWFNTLYFKGNSSESIFEFQFDEQKLNPFYGMFFASNNQFAAAANVMQDVFGLDPTGLTKDIRGDGGSLNAANDMIWKFSGASSGTTLVTRTSDQSDAHWFVYRYPDILLMKAEALAWTGDGQQALDLVDMVRTRAHALDQTAQAPDPSDAEGVTEYILAERAREFAFEGKRWFDVLRVAKRNNYANLGVLLSVVTKNTPGNLQQTVLNKYKDVRSHYLPINESELQADKKLVQNPYYQ